MGSDTGLYQVLGLAEDDGLDWMADGLCRETDPEIFFPEKGQGRADVTRAAKRVCHRCEVTDRCLEYALDTRDPWGIWGGHTTPEREALLSARANGQVSLVAVRKAVSGVATALTYEERVETVRRLLQREHPNRERIAAVGLPADVVTELEQQAEKDRKTRREVA